MALAGWWQANNIFRVTPRHTRLNHERIEFVLNAGKDSQGQNRLPNGLNRDIALQRRNRSARPRALTILTWRFGATGRRRLWPACQFSIAAKGPFMQKLRPQCRRTGVVVARSERVLPRGSVAWTDV